MGNDENVGTTQQTNPRPDGYVEIKKLIPTVGRVVYYKAFGTPGGEYKAGAERVAIITQVNSETSVGLCIINPTGLFFNQTVEQGEGAGQWDWMPFQKGIVR